MNRILIVEDERRLADALCAGFEAAGYVPTVVLDGASALAVARDEDFDLLILDLGLPGLDGMEVLRTLRGLGRRMPVVILSARDETRTKVEGLELGADDYVTKPYRFEELLARVRARLRDTVPGETTRLVVGEIELDLRSRRCTVADAAVQLSAREFTMLEVLMANPGVIVTREEFLSRVWGYEHDPGSNVVEVYVGYLRRKLGRDRIVTIRGKGYALAEGRGPYP